MNTAQDAANITQILMASSVDAAQIPQLAFLTFFLGVFFAVILHALRERGLRRVVTIILALPLLVVAGLVACYHDDSSALQF